MISIRKFALVATTFVSLAAPVTSQADVPGIGLGGSTFVTLAVMCAGGNPAACAAAGATSILMIVGVATGSLDKQQVELAKDDAKAFLVAGEMTPGLEDAIRAVRDAAQASGYGELSMASDEVIAAQIFTFQAQ